MGHNYRGILADKRLLSRFLKQVYSAYDTPSLIKLIAQDDKYLELCRAISNVNQKNSPRVFQDLDIECQKQGFDLYTIQLKLNPASIALGLVKSSGEQVDYYSLLGVEATADITDIRKAYRELARKTHPDTGTNGDSQAFVALNEAYQTLIDPDLRNYYDQSRQNLGLWNEQSDRRQKPKKRSRNIYQIVFILILFVFAAYLSNIVFHEKAITNDPYSGKAKDKGSAEVKDVTLNKETEFKKRQKELAGEVYSAMPLNEASSRDFSKANSREDEADSEMVANRRAAAIRNSSQSEVREDDKTSEASDHKTLREGVSAPANIMEVESSSADSERLIEDDAHVIEKDRHLSGSASRDIQAVLPAIERIDTISTVSSTKQSGKSRESQLKRLAKLKEAGNKKRLDTRFKNGAGKLKPVQRLGSNSRLNGGIHIDKKERSLSAGIKDNMPEVLLTLGRPGIASETSGLMEQAKSRQRQLKELTERKAEEEKRQLESRLIAFLRDYCNEYENKDIEKFSRFFAPDAIERGKPFKKLVYKYKKNFEVIRDIKYVISIRSYSRETVTRDISVKGDFSLEWHMNDGRFNESTGDIYFTLHENGGSFLVKRLDYTFTR